MSDLQDAIDDYDRNQGDSLRSSNLKIIVDAARKVANPVRRVKVAFVNPEAEQDDYMLGSFLANFLPEGDYLIVEAGIDSEDTRP